MIKASSETKFPKIGGIEDDLEAVIDVVIVIVTIVNQNLQNHRS